MLTTEQRTIVYILLLDWLNVMRKSYSTIKLIEKFIGISLFYVMVVFAIVAGGEAGVFLKESREIVFVFEFEVVGDGGDGLGVGY